MRKNNKIKVSRSWAFPSQIEKKDLWLKQNKPSIDVGQAAINYENPRYALNILVKPVETNYVHVRWPFFFFVSHVTYGCVIKVSFINAVRSLVFQWGLNWKPKQPKGMLGKSQSESKLWHYDSNHLIVGNNQMVIIPGINLLVAM